MIGFEITHAKENMHVIGQYNAVFFWFSIDWLAVIGTGSSVIVDFDECNCPIESRETWNS